MLPIIKPLQQEINIKPAPVRKKIKIYSEEQIEEFRKNIFPHSRAVIEKLANEPFLNHTKLQGALSGSRKQFKASIKWLIQFKFLREIECKSSKTRSAKFYALTPDAFNLLEIPKSKRKHGARLFKHDYYCMRVHKYLSARGLNPALEYLPGSLKTMGGFDRIDVYCKSKDGKDYANEITLSFSNYIGNIKKCDVAGMDIICIICENKGGIDSAKRKLENAHIKTNAEIQFRKINEYM